MPDDPILIEKTGEDWEPHERDQWYAQYQTGPNKDGLFAFGRTPTEALANLLK